MKSIFGNNRDLTNRLSKFFEVRAPFVAAACVDVLLTRWQTVGLREEMLSVEQLKAIKSFCVDGL